MAPVVTTLVSLLAIASSIDAKPLLTPGRHAPPTVANMLSHSRRSLHGLLARYYGTAHGLTKPPPLPEKRAATLPTGWSYVGCVAESYDQRLLSGFGFSSSSMTPLMCLTQCNKLGYSLAGTEYSDECYCADSYTGSGGAVSASSACNKPCAGDSTSMCGQAWLLSLYSYNDTQSACAGSVAATPVTATGSASSASSSATVVASTSSSNKTSTASASTTKATIASPSSTFAIHTDATDSSEWYSLGCAVDSASRLLDGYSKKGETALTIDGCLSLCEDEGYAFAGAEYGAECYCGNSVPTTITYSDTACNMPCSGDATETCGGGWALDLYELISSANVTACAATSTNSLTTANNLALPTAVTVASVSTTPLSSMGAKSTSVSTSSATAAPADPTTVPSSDNTHNVWAHHMVGNTYPYTQSSWLSDIQAASSYGIDGFALNMGSDSWQPERVADAYSAAASSGTGFKLFLSLDMTSLSCSSSSDAAILVNLIARFASNSAQAMHNGKVLVSTFAGSDCTFGTGSSNGWQGSFVDALKSQGVNIFFVPSLFSDISTFSSNTWMDGELNWNSGWPSGSGDIGNSDDSSYMSALGSKEYMPAISPFFYTHFGANSWNKNWLYRGDDWLYCTRWEEVIAMRQNVKMAEILTWNDYGESSYIGPITGALPSGSNAWVDGFDHESINILTKYYATAFKTGSYPTITEDSIIMWSRPHPHDATASADSVGKPTGWDWTDDNLYAVVLAKSGAVVSITSGSTTQTYSVNAGLTKLKMASSPGSMSAQMMRSGSVVAQYSAGTNFEYTTSPSTYNYNYMVGSSS